MAEVKNIKELARKLFLYNIANPKYQLKEEKMSNLSYLEYIFTEELRMRNDNKIKERLKDANLPNLKWKDRKSKDATAWSINELMKLKFINDETNVIISGDCSTGKTSLAVKVCTIAIENNYKVSYMKYDDYINTCIKKDTDAKYKKLYRKLVNSNIIVIDDFLYVKIKEEELKMFYKTIMFFNETRSLIIISNRNMNEWIEMVDDMSDSYLMNTLIERIKNNSKIIML